MHDEVVEAVGFVVGGIDAFFVTTGDQHHAGGFRQADFAVLTDKVFGQSDHGGILRRPGGQTSRKPQYHWCIERTKNPC